VELQHAVTVTFVGFAGLAMGCFFQEGGHILSDRELGNANLGNGQSDGRTSSHRLKTAAVNLGK